MFRDWEDVVEYDAQTVIFSESEAAELMYVILSGEVELTLQGKSLGVEVEGGIIGEMAIISPASRSATAKSLTDVKLAQLNLDQFKKLISGNTEFSLHVMAVMANRLRAVDQFITRHFDQLK